MTIQNNIFNNNNKKKKTTKDTNFKASDRYLSITCR